MTKAHRLVGPGDVLTFVQGVKVRVVRVRAVAPRRGRARDARCLYEEIQGD